LIAPGHERAFRDLLGAVKPLAALHSSLPFPWVLTFLTVAVEEGKSVGAYARELNVNRFLMSRYIRRIGDRARNGGPGLGLVTTKRAHSSPTRTAIFLTDKGRAIAAEVYRNLQLAAERPTVSDKADYGRQLDS
jgi:DNA-binding MarR family transcriptional regulator